MPTVLENLTKLRAIIAATPEGDINLNQTVSLEPTPTCGAIACVVGTAALHPYFNEQGLRWSSVGLLLHGEPIDYDDALLEPLFGKGVDGLFGGYGNGMEDLDLRMACDRWDDIVTDRDTGKVMSHKELALWRLDQRIKELS